MTNSFDAVQEISELEEGPGTLVPGPAQLGFFQPAGPAGGGQRKRDHAQIFWRLDEVLESEQRPLCSLKQSDTDHTIEEIFIGRLPDSRTPREPVQLARATSRPDLSVMCWSPASAGA